MGKCTSNSISLKAGAGRPSPFDLIIPNLPQPKTTSPTSPSSLKDEIFYDAPEYLLDGPLEEEVYYDALEDWNEVVEDEPTFASTPQTPTEGAEKGRPTTYPVTGPTVGPFSTTQTSAAPTVKPGLCHGSSKPTDLSITPEHTPTPPSTARLQAPRSPQRKAVLIGINYERCGKDDLRLRHAARDARRFASSLTKLGYSDENMKVVTDEQGQPLPSYDYLMDCIDWLVQDASEGDRLFFLFSGHCEPPTMDKQEPRLVAADLMFIPRTTFQERLVAKVPAGAELTIVLDCCNAAGMVKLKYCVGRMGYGREVMQTTESEAVSELEQPTSPAARGPPQHGSLLGLKGVDQPAAVPLFPSSQMTPVKNNPVMSFAPLNTQLRRGPGVVAARPLSSAAMPRPTQGSSLGSLLGTKAPVVRRPSPSAVNPFGPAQRRQLVVQGRPIRHFEERKTGFVAPAGKVVVWAGTGELQKAFEASGGVEGGVVADAICSVLETCLDKMVTYRDLWHSVVGAVDKENNQRQERDAKKPPQKRPAPSLRVQHAEVWVSQEDPLMSSSPILNQPIFWK
ncbi:hypothetical protein OPQ81_010656 [Rhizoctonia solani]|nr:hypothetical protein OPQ81_010656 [Rhizoctonia solani]